MVIIDVHGKAKKLDRAWGIENFQSRVPKNEHKEDIEIKFDI